MLNEREDRVWLPLWNIIVTVFWCKSITDFSLLWHPTHDDALLVTESSSRFNPHSLCFGFVGRDKRRAWGNESVTLTVKEEDNGSSSCDASDSFSPSSFPMLSIFPKLILISSRDLPSYYDVLLHHKPLCVVLREGRERDRSKRSRKRGERKWFSGRLELTLWLAIRSKAFLQIQNLSSSPSSSLTLLHRGWWSKLFIMSKHSLCWVILSLLCIP